MLALPALIDPHVHFRVPGHAYKEDWKTAAQAALCGGISMVFDMPNNQPACVTKGRMAEKRKLIDAQLAEVGIPLRYQLYLGADRHHLDEIGEGPVKVFMGSSTGSLLLDDQESLERVFQRAKGVVAVHAEDESLLRQAAFPSKNPADHSRMRPNRAAAVAVARAIDLTRKYGTRLYILHMSTREELELVRAAKEEGLPVFCEVTPHHLFLTTEDYARLGTRAQMNPPLRSMEDQAALWEGVREGTIDTIGTDHAPHTVEEKDRPFGEAPSGIPGVETLLPLMLNAVHEGRLTLERLVEMTHHTILKLFELPENDDVVWVDQELVREVGAFKSKCGWSPFEGMKLQGWPCFIRVQGKLFNLQTAEGRPQFVESVRGLPPYEPERWQRAHAQ